MITLYIIKHGETSWNKQGRIQGEEDSPLTKHGRYECQKLSEYLSETPFQALYASPSTRTVETADYIRGSRRIPVHYEEDLREINHQKWAGMTYNEIEKTDRELLHLYRNQPEEYQPEGGESLHNLKERVGKAIERIETDQLSGNVLVVTHQVAIRSLINFIKGRPLKEMWDTPDIAGSSITVFKAESGQYELQDVSAIPHLA
ncbi:histidine phosphatase family protein [Thalassobacillus sp. CUG 92003]|uniref:histidine phosphatase family protein n=1 Tax=Thalassobacillus sp. CUG 92003 TaxID=2736641 RepID=UPI0015E65317|nr:histidine phosphatase family protein [Thalassobacillus sp. CUG 92003]